MTINQLKSFLIERISNMDESDIRFMKQLKVLIERYVKENGGR